MFWGTHHRGLSTTFFLSVHMSGTYVKSNILKQSHGKARAEMLAYYCTDKHYRKLWEKDLFYPSPGGIRFVLTFLIFPLGDRWCDSP